MSFYSINSQNSLSSSHATSLQFYRMNIKNICKYKLKHVWSDKWSRRITSRWWILQLQITIILSRYRRNINDVPKWSELPNSTLKLVWSSYRFHLQIRWSMKLNLSCLRSVIVKTRIKALSNQYSQVPMLCHPTLQLPSLLHLLWLKALIYS